MNKILQTDALSGLQQLNNRSVNCIVTSPPYFGLRSYGTTPFTWPKVKYTLFGFPVHVTEMTCELGHEPDHFAFVGHLVLIFREAMRVLSDEGTLWLNIGDSYAGYHGNKKYQEGQSTPSDKNGYNENMRKSTVTQSLKQKDLIGIPWMLAYALRDDGWYLRQDIIWAKPNGMPESVRDRCTKSHEYVFMFSKSRKYYYDSEAIKTEAKESSISRVQQDTTNQVGGVVPNKSNGNMKAVLKGLPEGQTNIRKYRDKQCGHSRRHNGFNERWDQMSRQEQQSFKANKRSVWSYSPAQYPEDHFAVFPEELIWDMVLAGCPEGGCVLDPFFGRGTTGVVARKQHKNYIGIELLEKNVRLAEKYLYQELGMFK